MSAAASLPAVQATSCDALDIPPMDDAELRAHLDALGWPINHLTAVFGCSKSSAYDWAAGRRCVPALVAAWLRSHAAACTALLTANPPPRMRAAGWVSVAA